MINMSYCRLENTLAAMIECEEELLMSEAEISELKSTHELIAWRKLRQLIFDLAETMQDED
jgi:hypothetical protein